MTAPDCCYCEGPQGVFILVSGAPVCHDCFMQLASIDEISKLCDVYGCPNEGTEPAGARYVCPQHQRTAP